MPVVAEDYLKSAEELAQSSLEIDRRNSVSRAYYAAYHAIRASDVGARLENTQRQNGGVHQQLIDSLITSDAGSTARNLGVKLKTARQRRVRADYRLDDTIEGRDTAMQLAMVREILTICDGIDDSMAVTG